MTIAGRSIDSNVVGFHYAEEDTLENLASDLSTVTWYELEPNSYNDFGGEIETIAREPITTSRQNSKGTVTGLNSAGGLDIDLTHSNLTRLLQGFFFADAKEKGGTQNYNDTAVPITNVDATGKTFDAASGLDTHFSTLR